MLLMDPSVHHVLELPGACNSKVKCKKLMPMQVLFSLLCLQFATGSLEAGLCNDEETEPQAPDCLDDCRGRRFFLGVDGLCKMCIQCQPGFEHDKECGNGEHGDAVCVQCPEDHYSYNSYDCVACRVCENTLITQECSVSTDRQCGECLPGFYKDPQNPDLCNQRCEWLSNSDSTPAACKAWLDDQQVTTLSADVSMTSSFYRIIDEGIGRETTVIIIIIVLVVVVIGGSVIPVYLCCKNCKYACSKTADIERGNSRKNSVNIDIERNRAQTPVEHGASVGPQHDDTVDVNEVVRTSPITQGASEVGATNILLEANSPEQENDYRSVEKDREVKDRDKFIMDVFDSTSGIAHSPNDLNSMSDSQGGRGGENELCVLDGSDERSDSGDKIVHGLSKNKSSADKFYPSPNSHGEKFENNPLEISQDIQAPGTSHMAQTLRSTESTGIIQSDNEKMPRGLDSDGAPLNEGVEADDEQDGEEDIGHGEPDEGQKLLPEAPLQSRGSPVNSRVEVEHMPSCQDSEGGKRCEGADEEEYEEDSMEEHGRLLPNAQVEDLCEGATGGNDGEWRGSAEEESSKPKEKKKNDKPDTLQLPCHCGTKHNVTLHIENVTNLVLNDQINNYHDGV